jgi:tetratricopeptide (TPR) repeat protein
VAESWSRLGSALFQARQAESARSALLEALERDPDLAEARYQLGFALSALGDFRGALRETQRALEQAPVLPTPRYQLLIDVQFEEGTLPAPDAGEGERVATGTPVTDFDFEPGALDAAFASFAKPAAPAVTGPRLEDLLAEARTALRRGQLKKAAEIVGRAVAAAPGTATPRLLEGEVLLQRGLAGEALERFEAVLALDTPSTGQRGTALAGRAQALLELERFDAAIPAAREVEAFGGGAATLGRALLGAGQIADAVGAFERAVAEGEEDSATLTAYGNALLAAGRPADARRVFERSLAAGRNAAAGVGLARALEALGDVKGALAGYRTAVTAVPSYAPAVMGLAELQWRGGWSQEAIRSLVDLLALDPTRVEALVRLGTWLGELGRVEHAVRSLERALELEPGHAGARRELGRLQGGGGD